MTEYARMLDQGKGSAADLQDTLRSNSGQATVDTVHDDPVALVSGEFIIIML